jgi:3-dehydroquinate synthase
MKIDKKAKEGRMRLVLLRRIGECYVTSDFPDPALHSTVQAFFA